MVGVAEYRNVGGSCCFATGFVSVEDRTPRFVVGDLVLNEDVSHWDLDGVALSERDRNSPEDIGNPLCTGAHIGWAANPLTTLAG